MAYRQHSGARRRQAGGMTEDLASGLGWFSIALGVAELVAPRTLTNMLGIKGSETLVQAYGLREIATGIGILSSEDPTPWMWGRVAGDALDISTLVTGLSGDNPKWENVAFALAAVGGVTALDLYCAQALSRQDSQPALPMRDYRNRSGFPRPPEAMRGAARDFEIPHDMRTPEALRPYDYPESSTRAGSSGGEATRL